MSESRQTKAVNLQLFNNSWYKPGSTFKIVFWMIISALFFRHSLAVFTNFKCWLLRCFGAVIGKNVMIKPSVNIKYPWFLEVGDNVWLGENAWIDNLGKITIGKNAVISQGAFLLTGNHNYSTPTFDLIIGEIQIEEGCWIGAKSVVCPGITCGSHCVLAVASIATRNLDPYGIYHGNPAIKIRERFII